MATTLRVRADQPIVTDGPFAESAEVIGGYYRSTPAHVPRRP